MGFSFDAPEDVSGDDGNRIGEPGIYHMVISSVKEGEGPSGKPIDGFTFEADILGGTVEGCSGKVHRETLFAPNLSGSDAAQSMSRKKLASFFIATGLMDPTLLGKSINIDVEKAVGKQLVIELERQMEKDSNGKYTVPTKYVQVSYANIYHVDDPEVKDVPKNLEAIEMIGSGDRHDAAWFAFKAKRGSKSSQQQSATAPVGASATTANSFDDL